VFYHDFFDDSDFVFGYANRYWDKSTP